MQQDDHAERLQDARAQIRRELRLFLRDDRIDLINPDARANHPMIWFELDRIAVFRQRLRLARLWERPACKAAALLLRRLVDLLNVRIPIGVLCVETVRSLDILPAEQHDVVAIHRIDPEIALAAVIAQVTHAVGGLLLRLFLRELTCLLLLVILVENPVGDLCLSLELIPHTFLEVSPVRGKLRVIIAHRTDNEIRTNAKRRYQRDAADGKHQTRFHGSNL